MQNLINKTGRKGQGLVEYILVVFLMALGCIGAIKLLQAGVIGGFAAAAAKLIKEFV